MSSNLFHSRAHNDFLSMSNVTYLELFLRYSATKSKTTPPSFSSVIDKNPLNFVVKNIGKSKGMVIIVRGNPHPATGNHMPCGVTQCYLPPGSSDYPALLQPRLLLDLATPEECKAKLMWMAVTSQYNLPAKYGHLSPKTINQCYGWELNPRSKVASPMSP